MLWPLFKQTQDLKVTNLSKTEVKSHMDIYIYIYECSEKMLLAQAQLFSAGTVSPGRYHILATDFEVWLLLTKINWVKHHCKNEPLLYLVHALYQSMCICISRAPLRFSQKSILHLSPPFDMLKHVSIDSLASYSSLLPPPKPRRANSFVGLESYQNYMNKSEMPNEKIWCNKKKKQDQPVDRNYPNGKEAPFIT